MQIFFSQHTQETGQRFEPEALDRVWELTEGQPWLVNALGYEVCFKMKEGRYRSRVITLEMIDKAKENILLRRDTHIDQLADKLQEERVRRVVEPILAGGEHPERIPVDDISYVHDLGLIKIEGQIRIANKIYQEVIPRELTYSAQLTISQEASWYVKDIDGSLAMNKLLIAFQQFFREHSEYWVERFEYKEAGPQLLLQAFLQRIINSGGSVEREYGLGRMRTDLLAIWPYKNGVQKIVLELKILYGSLNSTIEKGVRQTWEYMDHCGAPEGHLVIFDRGKEKSWEEKIFRKEETYKGKRIGVWGM